MHEPLAVSGGRVNKAARIREPRDLRHTAGAANEGEGEERQVDSFDTFHDGTGVENRLSLLESLKL